VDDVSGTCSAHRGDEKCVQNCYWEARRAKTARKTKHRWEDNNKMYLREIELQGVDWIYVAQDRDRWRAVVNTVMNHAVLRKAENLLSSWG
jgi:hypothetical protein